MSAGATGTARTTRAAPSRRAIRQATRAVDPVAIPSSTITAMRPVRSRLFRPFRNWATRFSSTAAFVHFDSLQLTLGYLGLGEHAFFQHPCAAFPDGTHGEFPLVRKSQFPNHNHIQGGVQGCRHLEGDGDPSSGQPQDHNVLSSQFPELPPQLPTGVDPVLKNAHRQGFPRETSAALCLLPGRAPERRGAGSGWPLSHYGSGRRSR